MSVMRSYICSILLVLLLLAGCNGSRPVPDLQSQLSRNQLEELAKLLSTVSKTAELTAELKAKLQQREGSRLKPLSSPLLAEQWNFTLSESSVRSTFLFPSFTTRLKQVVLKLLAGERVVIGGLGGSVMAGRYANPNKDWFSLVVQWLQKAFPKAQVVARNGGVPGTNSHYIERCCQHHLDPDVDLVFVEFSMNNHGGIDKIDNPGNTSFERLIRMLMQRECPGVASDAHPATVSFVSASAAGGGGTGSTTAKAQGRKKLEEEEGAVTAVAGTGRSVLSAAAGPAGAAGGASTTAQAPAVLITNMWRCCLINNTQMLPFQRTPEDHFNVIAQYYGIPVVSVRSALHPLFVGRVGPYAQLDDYFPPVRGSRTHPNDAGSVLIADTVVGAFYAVLEQLQAEGVTDGDLEQLARTALPPPLLPAAEHHINQMCKAQTDMQLHVAEAKGWAYVQDAPGKWGWVAQEPGATLLLKVDSTIAPALQRVMSRGHNLPSGSSASANSTVAAAKPQAQASPQGSVATPSQSNRTTASSQPSGGTGSTGRMVFVVHLGFLKSYERAGQVQVECVKGCRCKTSLFNTHDPADLTSQTAFYAVDVTEARECLIRLTVLQDTTSKDHKVKLATLATSMRVEDGPAPAAAGH